MYYIDGSSKENEVQGIVLQDKMLPLCVEHFVLFLFVCYSEAG